MKVEKFAKRYKGDMSGHYGWALSVLTWPLCRTWDTAIDNVMSRKEKIVQGIGNWRWLDLNLTVDMHRSLPNNCKNIFIQTDGQVKTYLQNVDVKYIPVNKYVQ